MAGVDHWLYIIYKRKLQRIVHMEAIIFCTVNIICLDLLVKNGNLAINVKVLKESELQNCFNPPF